MRLALLTSIGLVVFKGSLDIMAPRQWIIQQNMSDAYLTYEEAYAQRISFEQLTSMESPWPVYPEKSATEVEIGKFPGGRPIMAEVTRTRIPDSNNLPEHGGTGTECNKPHRNANVAGAVSPFLSVLATKEYVKSRTIIRTQ